jgi:hypothetical protein
MGREGQARPVQLAPRRSAAEHAPRSSLIFDKKRHFAQLNQPFVETVDCFLLPIP